MNADPTFGPHPADFSDFDVVDMTPVEAWHHIFDVLHDTVPQPWPRLLQHAADILEQAHQ